MRARVSNSQSQSSSQQIQLSYSKNKPSIKLKQWMHSFKPINSFKLKQHILGYLIQQGLYDVAVSFSQQANIPFPKVNQENVKFRYAIKKQITNGNIDKVLQMIKKIQPQFQNDLKNSELLFKLKCLKVIKLIKQNRIKQSIQIAKKQLLPFSKNGQIYIKQIQKIMGLLAYVDLKKSPYYQITKNQYSNKIAKRINQHIINKNQQQIDQSLQTLLKIGKWCQNRLLNYIKFPKLNLSQNGQLFQQPMQWFLFLINYIQKFQYYNKYYQHQNMNRQSQQKAMHTLIDKLTDHLTPQRIQILIDNGFDQWQTITYLKGTQLVQLGFDMNQCIIIMVACNSVSNQLNQSDIFTQARMQQVLSLAKIQDQKRQNDLLKQQQLNQNNNYKNNQQEIISPQKNKNLISSPSSPVLIKQKPTKQITQRLISKCVYPKPRQGQKVNFKKITVLSLQQKQLTHIKNLQIIPNLQTLNLNTNFIQQITGLQTLYKIRVLSMQRNNLLSMKGLSSLINLQSLILNSNFISKIQGLQNCKYLKQLKLNRQKINGQLQIQQSSMISLSYSLQLLQIKNSKLKNIKPLKHLLCLRQANLQKNLIQEVSDLSQTLTTMQSLQILSLKQNPLTKSLKYRDYVVILNKTITQLDGKKILPKERQYLVKLYAMKHKRNNAEQKKQKIIKPSISLKGIKLQQQSYNTQPNINRATDLRGTGVYANTKMLTRNIIARALTQNTIFNVSLQNKPLKIAFQGNTKLATQTLKSLAQRFQTKYQTVRTNFHIHPKSFDINSQQHQTLLNRFEFVKNLSQQSGLRGAVGKAMKKSFLQSKRLGFTLKDNEIQEFIKTVQNNFSSQQQVIKIITQCPNLINAKFNIIIQQKLSIIIDYLAISKQQAMKIFQATPFLLPSSPKKFRQSILTLKDVYKFNKQQIIFLMKNMGEIFILGKQTLADIHHLPISWGLTLQQTKKLFLEHPVLFFNYPYNMALFKRRILKFLSFTVPMGRKILLQYPGILVWSVRSLQQKALFVVNRLQMKFNQQNLACLAFNYNKTLRPRGQMLIRSKYVFNDKNIVQLMKLSDEQFCQKTGVALQRLQKQKQKFQISEQLDFRKGRLLDNIKFNQKFKELSKKYEF